MIKLIDSFETIRKDTIKTFLRIFSNKLKLESWNKVNIKEIKKKKFLETKRILEVSPSLIKADIFPVAFAKCQLFLINIVVIVENHNVNTAKEELSQQK